MDEIRAIHTWDLPTPVVPTITTRRNLVIDLDIDIDSRRVKVRSISAVESQI